MTDASARKPLAGSKERRIETYRPRVAEINALEKQLEGLSDDALRARSEDFKKRLADDKARNDEPADDMTARTRRNERDGHNLAAGMRARLKSASLAARPPAKGFRG